MGSGTLNASPRSQRRAAKESAYLRRVDMGAVEREDELADLELQPPFAHGWCPAAAFAGRMLLGRVYFLIGLNHFPKLK